MVPEVASLKEHPLWSPQRPGTRPAALAEWPQPATVAAGPSAAALTLLSLIQLCLSRSQGPWAEEGREETEALRRPDPGQCWSFLSPQAAPKDPPCLQRPE